MNRFSRRQQNIKNLVSINKFRHFKVVTATAFLFVFHQIKVGQVRPMPEL